MFRRGQLDAIKPGQEYRPPVPGFLMTTARVLTIGPDAYGIPHVHFEIRLGPASARTALVQEIRVLSLESFAALYPKPVAA
jgi:hypothetical protein